MDNQNESKIDAVSGMVDDICELRDKDSFDASTSKIILTDPLKTFINKCKNNDNLALLKTP